MYGMSICRECGTTTEDFNSSSCSKCDKYWSSTTSIMLKLGSIYYLAAIMRRVDSSSFSSQEKDVHTMFLKTLEGVLSNADI